MATNRKYIIIGESTLGIDIKTGGRVTVAPIGAMLGTAIELARSGEQVLFISEIGNDAAGTRIAERLRAEGVDISYSDRFSEGKTSLCLTIDGATSRYDLHLDAEGFDISWPRIEKEDVVVFGGYTALDPRISNRLRSFLSYAVERRATMVYIPDIDDVRVQRITKVMPQVFENLETATIVIATRSDLSKIFGTDDPDKAFRNNVSFYCDRLETVPEGADAVPAIASTLKTLPLLEE